MESNLDSQVVVLLSHDVNEEDAFDVALAKNQAQRIQWLIREAGEVDGLACSLYAGVVGVGDNVERLSNLSATGASSSRVPQHKDRVVARRSEYQLTHGESRYAIERACEWVMIWLYEYMKQSNEAIDIFSGGPYGTKRRTIDAGCTTKSLWLRKGQDTRIVLCALVWLLCERRRREREHREYHHYDRQRHRVARASQCCRHLDSCLSLSIDRSIAVKKKNRIVE